MSAYHELLTHKLFVPPSNVNLLLLPNCLHPFYLGNFLLPKIEVQRIKKPYLESGKCKVCVEQHDATSVSAMLCNILLGRSCVMFALKTLNEVVIIQFEVSVTSEKFRNAVRQFSSSRFLYSRSFMFAKEVGIFLSKMLRAFSIFKVV